MGAMKGFYKGLISVGGWFQHLLLLLLRVCLGAAFMHAGLGKLMHIGDFVDFLSQLGFPAAKANAYFVASLETVGGFSLLLGLGARLMGLVLMLNMAVAYLTAHMEAVHMLWTNPGLFVAQDAFLFLLTSALVFAFGPGAISVDALLKRYVLKGK